MCQQLLVSNLRPETWPIDSVLCKLPVTTWQENSFGRVGAKTWQTVFRINCRRGVGIRIGRHFIPKLGLQLAAVCSLLAEVHGWGAWQAQPGLLVLPAQIHSKQFRTMDVTLGLTSCFLFSPAVGLGLVTPGELQEARVKLSSPSPCHLTTPACPDRLLLTPLDPGLQSVTSSAIITSDFSMVTRRNYIYRL